MNAPAQKWATEGIAPMERPGIISRLFMRVIVGCEQLNRAQAKHGNPCVHRTGDFPWAAAIEREWRVIRDEAERVLSRKGELPNMQDIAADAISITQDAAWKIFILMAYGIRSEPSIALCPNTWRLVRAIPGLTTAMFSVLEPGKRLPPHRGPYNGVLRLHLGLIIPEPESDIGIRVGSEICRWHEGQALIFDDAFEHEVWNNTAASRVVLFMDFAKPLRFPASLINRLLLRLAVWSPYLRDGTENLRRWERRFYGTG
jgi:aspartyl/asparaginyl beta-hydroxylase (cupin superfamily)